MASPNASFRWAARWWDYPEALTRIDALLRAWGSRENWLCLGVIYP
ncbi:DUF4913 domain-containing protein [Cryobacterium sp. Y62]